MKNRKADRNSLGKSRNSRVTIGYLAFSIDGDVANAIWVGMAEAARRRDVNLICFVGEKLRNPTGFLAQANVLYDLVDPGRIDGLIIWASTISAFVDPQACVAFTESYHPLPMVSLGTVLAGIPSVQVENYQSVREMMIHLIEVHGYRRLAFIRGPENHPYAQERYRAYIDTLAEYGLPLDRNLITPPGDWSQSTGYEMTCLLLDQRGLQPQLDLEAVVTASDLFALGALEAFQTRGVQVPEEIGIVGFNNSIEGRAVTPPLTSVAIPFPRQGEQALEMVLAMLAGEQVPEQVVLPARLVVHQSCGCVDSAVVQAAVKRVDHPSDHPPSEAHRETLISEMMQAVQTHVESLAPDWTEQLVKAFTSKIDDEAAGAFLATLARILAQVTTASKDVFAWQNVISALRRYALSYSSDSETLYRAENLMQQARVLINEITLRSQLYQEVQTKQYTQTLRRIGQALITTFDVARLRDTLAKEFPALGIPSCYLSLYENPQVPTEAARLILAYDQTGQIELEPGDRRFPSRQLVPHKFFEREKRYTMIVTSLYFEKTQLGFALFEMGPTDGATYGTLRGQISSALQGALLLQERQRAEQALEKAYAGVEKQVDERTRELQQEIVERRKAEEELKRYRERLEELVKERTRELEQAQAELVRQERLSVLGQLTATVAHEIRNPLGTVRTSVFAIGDAIERDERGRVERALQLAERNILRCDGIISELLDYTHDRVLRRKPMNLDVWLDHILNEQALPESIVCLRALNANVEVSIDSEHLRRAVINVVNNAIEAMQEARRERSSERLSELDKGGNRLTVSTHLVSDDRVEIRINDTGGGIPNEVMDKLFEPLFSTKSFGVGLGMPIVKNVLEQHNGGIEIISESGGGTTVVLWLPTLNNKAGLTQESGLQSGNPQ
jgi:DNA-binding LacI/PurR family transcriptional regulator/signal transduction histidine kinase